MLYISAASLCHYLGSLGHKIWHIMFNVPEASSCHYFGQSESHKIWCIRFYISIAIAWEVWVTQMWHMRFYSPANSVPLHGQSGSPKICRSTFGLISFLTLSQSWHRQVLGSQTGTWDFSSFFVPVHRQSGSHKICHIMFDLDCISVLCTTRILSPTLLPMPSKLCGRWREIMSIWPVDRKQ